jgi:hypothetical protein
VVAFCLDARNLLAGNRPGQFAWPIFLSGLGIGLAGFTFAFCRKSPPRHSRATLK